MYYIKIILDYQQVTNRSSVRFTLEKNVSEFWLVRWSYYLSSQTVTQCALILDRPKYRKLTKHAMSFADRAEKSAAEMGCILEIWPDKQKE